MGQQPGAQDRLFYSFNLDAHVPADHLLRGVDQFLDLSDLRKHPAGAYSHTGLLERAGEVFDGPRRKDEPAVDVKAMQAKIGQLALENDFLEGALTKAGMLSAKR